MENTQKDEILIREIFNRSTEAWNTKDIDLFGSLYTNDVDYITFMGEHIHGLDANLDLHRKLWKSHFMKKARMEGGVIAVKFPGEDTAIMIAKGGIGPGSKKLPADRMSVNTSVLVRQEGSWKICSFQNTRVTGYNFFMRFLMWIDKKISK